MYSVIILTDCGHLQVIPLFSQDGIASPEDVDQAVIEGLGLRYSFMGLFETMHVNADGMEDYCRR